MMTNRSSAFTGLEHLRDPDVAAAALATYLCRGELSLLLGAGVSRGLGLPNWVELVKKCEVASGLADGSGESSLELMSRADTARRRIEKQGRSFMDAVHEALYPAELRENGQYADSILANRLMISLGALVMSSVRGSVTDVLSLNFDDALEWYLHLHGFRTQVVQEYPAILRSDVDVRIHHIHGFLPLREEYGRSEWLVLTKKQLTARLASDAGAPWPALIGVQLMSKVLLAVGSSMSDIDLDVVFERAGAAVDGARPLGFVVGVDLTEARQTEMLELGLVPVALAQVDEIPSLLLEICQRAAAVT